MAFKDNFQIIRDFRSKKQAEIAEGTGISKQNISNWANGLNEPSTENLDLLAKFLDVPRQVFYMETLTQEYLKRNFMGGNNTSVQEPSDNKQNGATARETFYEELMEKNKDYFVAPRSIFTDYKIVPDKIIDVIIQSNANEIKAMKEAKDLEMKGLIKDQESLIAGYENKIKRLEGENQELASKNQKLEQENRDLLRQIPAKQ